MNFDLVARQLAAAVRGDRSPMLLSRKLGFRGNQLRRWESGERRVTWDDFVALCEICTVPIGEAIERVLSVKDGTRDGAAICERLIGGATQTKVSQVTGISRFTILRWFSRKSRPALADVLAVVHACQFLALEFIAALVEIEKVPEANREYIARQARKQAYYRFPIGPAVLCCLQLEEYKALPAHQPGYVARKLLITDEEEAAALAELERVGKIVLRDGRYAVTAEQLELTDSHEIRAFCAFWLDRAAWMMRSLDHPFPAVNCGLDVYATNRKTAARIKEEYRIYFQKVRALLAQDEGPRDSVCVFNSVLLDMAAAGERAGAPPRAPMRRSEPSVPFPQPTSYPQ
jgi:transcriptional regulator with XRE-family HTH domain